MPALATRDERTRGRVTGFRHEAVLYAGEDAFVERLLPFVRDAVACEEPLLVAVDAPKIARLRSVLGADAEQVRFEDMALLGRNPARIIPAWQDFADAHADGGRPMRGIGEPISAARDGAELAECHRHEALLNLAFADVPWFTLLCPYDTEALPADVIARAGHTHPCVRDDVSASSAAYAGLDRIAQPFDEPLAPPPADAEPLRFAEPTLPVVRELVARHALATGLDVGRRGDLVLAVNELATNSVRHAGGGGLLRIWREHGAVVCEVRDEGRIDHPLVGRVRPDGERVSGYGLWLVNQLCDLVQVRSGPAGATVRVRMSRN